MKLETSTSKYLKNTKPTSVEKPVEVDKVDDDIVEAGEIELIND